MAQSSLLSERHAKSYHMCTGRSPLSSSQRTQNTWMQTACNLLFAINHQWEPDWKWLRGELDHLAIKPGPASTRRVRACPRAVRCDSCSSKRPAKPSRSWAGNARRFKEGDGVAEERDTNFHFVEANGFSSTPIALLRTMVKTRRPFYAVSLTIPISRSSTCGILLTI